MQRLLADLIKFNNQVSQQRVDQQATEPMSTNTIHPTENRDSLFRPTLGILDRDTLCLYKAMDLAG